MGGLMGVWLLAFLSGAAVAGAGFPPLSDRMQALWLFAVKGAGLQRRRTLARGTARR